MSAFLRLARALALVLAVVVAGEALDVLPCADEAGPTATTTGHADGASGADCLCHLAYVPAAALAPVAAAPAPRPGRFAPYAGRAQRGVRRVPHPPPLG